MIISFFILNAEEIKTVNPLDYSDNRYKLEIPNVVNYTFSSPTIYTSSQLYVDETYDPRKDKTWFEVNKRKLIKTIILFIEILIIIMLIIDPNTQCLGFTMLKDGLKAGLSGATTAAIKGLVSSIKGNVFIDVISEQMVKAFVTGFTIGTIISFVTHLNPESCNCFKKGTLVLTKEGSKPIEEIKEGDEVYSYNEKTKKKELKKVVRLFKNKTKKWIHLKFSKKEEIICTEEHPFYIKNKGWILAKNIVEKDNVLMYNNSEAELISKYVKTLSIEDTYNFEVESNHNYYVGESYILTHNKCANGGSYNSEDDVQECSKGNIPNKKVGKGQVHHVISQRINTKMHKELRDAIIRNDYLVRALQPQDHRGYQAWHRLLDKTISEYASQCISLEEFENYINKMYSDAELVSKFGQ